MSLQYIEDFASSPTTSPVLTVQWATSNIVLTGHLDGTLCAFDATNGLLLAQINAHADSLHCLAIHPSLPDRALSSALDGTASLWSFNRLHPIPEGSEEPQRATSEREGAKSESGPTTLDLQPLATATLLGSDGEPVLLPSTALHPSGHFFAAAGQGARLSLHSARPDDFAQVIAATSSHRSTAVIYTTSIAFSHSGTFLALGTDLGHVRLYSLPPSESARASVPQELQMIAEYTSHALPIRALAFDTAPSGHDNHLFVGSDDCIITLYDIASLAPPKCAPKLLLNPVSFLQGHKGTIDHLAPVPVPLRNTSQGVGGPKLPFLLASTSVQDGFIRLWDLEQRPKRSVCIIRAGGDTSTSTSSAAELTGHTVGSNEVAGMDGTRVRTNGEGGHPQDQGQGATINGDAEQGETPDLEETHGAGAQRIIGGGRVGATSVAWRPLWSEQATSAEPPMSAAATFVAGGVDGIVRWYRAGGTGGEV